ncbi:MAG: DUF4198 domain-containing protein [Candidatus Puniceispirillales bacterium]
MIGTSHSIVLRTILAGVMLLAAVASITPLRAHEFWIDPETWHLEQGETLRVALRVGTGFNGSQQMFFPARISRFDLVGPQQTLAFKGRLGDRPAGRITPEETGLHIISHATTFTALRYTDFEKFAAFTREKGLGDAVSRHRARQLPESDFVERYRRFAKSLIAVGSAEGQDRVLGMEVEITALANPFALTGDTMPLRLDRDGAPWPGVLVTVFARPLGSRPDATVVSTYRADAAGRVVILTRPGHAYLVDAVSLEEAAASGNPEGAVWSSRWASLSFATPR